MGILVSDLLEELAPYVGDSGACPTDSTTIIAALNEVIPMVIKRLDAKGTVPQWCVPSFNEGCFALPYDCLEVRTILLDGFPLVQRDMWYEGKISVGLTDGSKCNFGTNCNQNAFVRTCDNQNLIDLGDGFPVPHPWPDCNNSKLGLKAESDGDAGKLVQIDLINEYFDQKTEKLELPAQQQIVPTASFVRDVKFIRKPVTDGNIIGYAIWPDGRQWKMFTLPPKVTSPSWHRKRLPRQFPCGRSGTILIRGKARFIRLTSVDDVCLIDDTKCLQFGLRALAALKRDDFAAYNQALAMSVNEADKQLGDANSRAIVGQASILSPFGRQSPGRRPWA